MRYILLLLLGCISLGAYRTDKPKLFHQREFSPADFAQTVNYFVAMGEQQAVRELGKMGPERVGWVCRVLFVSKTDKPLRPPLYGGLSLPDHTMPLEDWPLYPVAASGKSYFVLSQGYTLAGSPESVKHYLDYCRSEGTFRTEPVPVPTKAEAQEDAAALRNSPAWKAIKWKDSGQGWSYEFSEEFVWRFIQAQADRGK